MSLYGAFDQTNHLSELTVPLDTQSGVKTPAQRKALAIANLGLGAAPGAAGGVTASAAVVVDANKDVGVFRNLRATRIIYQGGAPISDATAGNRTWTAAEILTGIIVRATTGASRSDTLPTAALLVAGLPGAQVGDTIEFMLVNGASAAETITINAGAGGAFDANQPAGTRVLAQNVTKLINIRLTNVTPASEAYVVYM